MRSGNTGPRLAGGGRGATMMEPIGRSSAGRGGSGVVRGRPIQCARTHRRTSQEAPEHGFDKLKSCGPGQGKGRHRSPSRPRRRPLQARLADAKEKAGPLAEQAKEKATELASKAAPAVSHGVDKAADSIDKATDGRFADKLDMVQEKVHTAADKVAQHRADSASAKAVTCCRRVPLDTVAEAADAAAGTAADAADAAAAAADDTFKGTP